MRFGRIGSLMAVALAGIAAAASGAGQLFTGKGVNNPTPPASAWERGIHRCRGQLSRPSRKQEIKDWGRSRSWSGAWNRDNPAGTKLRKKVTKQQLTVRKGW